MNSRSPLFVLRTPSLFPLVTLPSSFLDELTAEVCVIKKRVDDSDWELALFWMNIPFKVCVIKKWTAGFWVSLPDSSYQRLWGGNEPWKRFPLQSATRVTPPAAAVRLVTSFSESSFAASPFTGEGAFPHARLPAQRSAQRGFHSSAVLLRCSSAFLRVYFLPLPSCPMSIHCSATNKSYELNPLRHSQLLGNMPH